MQMEGGAWIVFQIGEGEGREPSATHLLLSPQNPEVLSLGLPGLDTNQVPNWPGLRILLQQLPPQDIDVGVPLFALPLFTYRGKNLGPEVREHGFKA